MAKPYNVIYGILFPSAWCILVCCSRLFMGIPTVLGDDINNPGDRNMYYRFGDSRKTNENQNVNNMGSGNIHIVYGDCSASSVNTHANVYGSGDIYLMYGYSCGSCVSSNANKGGEWVQNMFNQGSGDLFIKYGRCSPTLDLSVYNRGSGTTRIYYENYSNSGATHTISDGGSGKVYVQYANQG